ncbi:hypothetical protein [Reichenbachiella sp. MALMAid0571]|uniref:hypothetical protein n=1 Tax=Reichenbachiella sp. MALMAid0571 TaxID=3143939 RepID=UPI0032DE63CC
MALKKNVKPIVERQIINTLKGFIHKQVDLPYSYEPQNENEIENTNFLKTFRDLISDLESEIKGSSVIEERKTLLKKLSKELKGSNRREILRENVKTF